VTTGEFGSEKHTVVVVTGGTVVSGDAAAGVVTDGAVGVT
jgi:hypothetical protein